MNSPAAHEMLANLEKEAFLGRLYEHGIVASTPEQAQKLASMGDYLAEAVAATKQAVELQSREQAGSLVDRAYRRLSKEAESISGQTVGLPAVAADAIAADLLAKHPGLKEAATIVTMDIAAQLAAANNQGA